MTTQPWLPMRGAHSFAHGGAGRHQGEVHAAKVEILEILAFQAIVAVGDLDTHRPARGDGEHLVGGEFPLGQDIEHLPPDIAGGADNGDFVAHDSRSFVLGRVLAFGRGCKGKRAVM